MFTARIPQEAAIKGVLRMVLQGDPGAGAPAFLAGFRVEPVQGE